MTNLKCVKSLAMAATLLATFTSVSAQEIAHYLLLAESRSGDGAQIAGDSQDEDHIDWFDVISYSMSVSTNGSSFISATGGGPGKAKFLPLTVNIKSDPAAPQLYESVIKNTTFPRIVIESQRPTQSAPYYQLTLTNAAIASFEVGPPTGENSITDESLTIVYEEFKIVYRETATDGSLEIPGAEFCWDLRNGVMGC